jgi:hypothetical protein
VGEFDRVRLGAGGLAQVCLLLDAS